MAFNCKLSRNISLNPSGSEANDCGSSEIASGGINERIYVYNIDDVENLMFDNDNRFDDTLIIDTIITSMAYYYIDTTDASYNENQDGNKHTHTLTLTVANSNPITEDTLNEAVHHRYLVAFRPKGADLYRVFGWKEGAGMSYTMDIDSDTNAYTITLTDESEYALMSCQPDNFNLANKEFTPIFKPLYDISYCEVGQGNQRTGYCIASYVVKVNSAGQALDEDNKLCQYSEKPQDAYKYYLVSDGTYNILGTYTDTASFDGLPVKIFDVERCPIGASGTISFSQNEVWLNSTTTTYEDVTINAYSSQGSSTCVPWTVIEKPNEVSLSQTSGQTCGTITVISNNIGLDGGRIVVRNNTTYEQAYILVYVNLIKVNEEYTYQSGTTDFDITPIVEPLGSDYTYSIDRSGLTITKLSDGTLHFVVDNPSSDFQTWTLTLTHSEDAREKKYVAINILGSNTNPVWRMMAQYCEEGTPTQYRWVTVSGQYVCVGYDKHTEEKQQESMDGETWTDVVPLQTRAGTLIEANSEDCGYVPPTPPTPTQYRWVTVSGQYECVGYDKYSVEKKQQSTDGGETWTDVVPTETRTGSLIEANSEDCGYVPPTPPTPSTQYLTFEALEDGTFTFTGTSTNSLSYSLDNGTTWTALASGSASPTVTSGNKIMWKGITTPQSSNPYGIGTFSSTGRFNVENNAMSLLFGDNFAGQTSLTGYNYVFFRLFYQNTNLVSAGNMSLPATTLAQWCYYGMFYGCTSLVNAPALPATTLPQWCYYQMFQGCTSLVNAPALPATTLAYCCYLGMFLGCTSLTTAPALPSTTLADSCYGGMFRGCTSLTTAPVLPATTLAQSCYDSMFRGCTSLVNAPVLPATTLANGCYKDMFDGCTSLVNAPVLPATTLANGCYSGMFYHCTSLTTEPTLPATTMAYLCYFSMFNGCTSLTTAPVLPATTLADGCYQQMFWGCTRLNSITCLATNISATDCTKNWVYNVAARGTFTKDTNMSSWTTGDNGIPSGWTVQNQ